MVAPSPSQQLAPQLNAAVASTNAWHATHQRMELLYVPKIVPNSDKGKSEASESSWRP